MTRLCLTLFLLSVCSAVFSKQDPHSVILQYHHIANHTPPSTSVSLPTFKQHMQLLKDEGFSVLSMDRAVAALQQGTALPDKNVVITFDDAYDDIYYNAAPLLKELGFAFTLFVSTDFVDRKQKGYMTWDQIRELQSQGALIANHTQSHLHLLRKWNDENEDQWKQRLKAELLSAENIIEQETGARWKYFAYPYGEADERVVRWIKDWGFIGFGQQSGAVDKRLLDSGMAPRFPFNEIYKDINDFRLKAQTLPFPLSEEQYEKTLWESSARPELVLVMAEPLGTPTCFASGQGMVPVKQVNKNTVRIIAKEPVGVGRSRYNCTLAVPGKAGRYYWYSRMWIRKNDDGSWYPEP